MADTTMAATVVGEMADGVMVATAVGGTVVMGVGDTAVTADGETGAGAMDIGATTTADSTDPHTRDGKS